MLTHKLKIAYHKDLAAHPLTHSWIINLYRAGEDHHFTVDDYFPYEHAPYSELANHMREHRQDEAKHGNLFLKFLKKKNWEITDYIGNDVYNNVVRQHTPTQFQIFDTDKDNIKRIKLANFLAHAHFLEKRVAQSLCYHQEACNQLGKTEILETLNEIYKDENKHVTYTRQAVFDLLTQNQARKVLELHKAAEKKANIHFSRAQIGHLLKHKSQFLSKHNALFLKFCAFLVDRTTHYAM